MGLEVKIYDTPAGGIRASQGTFSSFTARSNLVILAFLWEKSENSGFFRNIAACDLKVGICRQLIEIMKVCEY